MEEKKYSLNNAYKHKFPHMKTFIFSTYSMMPSKDHYKVCAIYRMKNNHPYLLGTVDIPIYSKGDISVVFKWLIDNKYIPKKYYNLSKAEYMSGGYYDDRIVKFGYKIIGV